MSDSKQGEGRYSPPHFIVTLVHGTFARDAKWTQHGSPLRLHLKKSLPGTVEFPPPLEWSAKNRNRDRKAAAHRLANQIIRQQPPDGTQALQFVVGHSHGGNVALYALDRPAVEEAIDGVVCFNTPFIAALRRNTKQLLRVVSFFAVIAVVAAFITVGYELWNARDNLILLLVGLPLASAGVVVLLYAVGFLVIGADYWLQAKREETIIDISLPEVKRVPVLCLWGAGDEVQGFLGLLETLANVPFLMLHIFSVAALFLTTWVLHFTGTLDRLITLPVGTGVSFGNPAIESVQRGLETGFQHAVSAAFYVALVVLGLVAAALLMNLFLRLVPIGLPAVSFISSLFVRVRFTVAPVTVRTTEFHDAALPFSVLQHSSAYSDPTMLETMSRWMINIGRERRLLPSATPVES